MTARASCGQASSRVNVTRVDVSLGKRYPGRGLRPDKFHGLRRLSAGPEPVGAVEELLVRRRSLSTFRPSSRIQRWIVCRPGLETTRVAGTPSIVFRFQTQLVVLKPLIRSAEAGPIPSSPAWRESSVPAGAEPRTQTE